MANTPAKLYNRANLLVGKIAPEYLVFLQDRTFGTNRIIAAEVTLPVVQQGYSEEEEESGEEITFPEQTAKQSLSPKEDFMIEAKPLIKDLALYKDKENPWTNQTFVITKFEKIVPSEVQLDIEGNEAEINHNVVFTSTDGNTLNTKQMVSLEVNPVYLENPNLFNPGENPKLKLKLYGDDIKALFDIFAEFLKDAPGKSPIEMVVGQDNKIYLTATNDETEQVIRGVSSTIAYEDENN